MAHLDHAKTIRIFNRWSDHFLHCLLITDMDRYFYSDITCRCFRPTAAALQAPMNKLKCKLLRKSQGWNLWRTCHPLYKVCQGYIFNTCKEKGCFDLERKIIMWSYTPILVQHGIGGASFASLCEIINSQVSPKHLCIKLMMVQHLSTCYSQIDSGAIITLL